MIVGWTTAQLRLIIILQLDTLGYFEQDKLTWKFYQFWQQMTLFIAFIIYLSEFWIVLETYMHFCIISYTHILS